MLNKKFKINLKKKKVNGKIVTLRKINYKDCDNKYLSWLKDKKINKFLECRIENLSIPQLKRFVKKCNTDLSTILFGIFFKDIHIGNIKIDINYFHKFCHIGYFIGEKNYQKKGMATEAIQLCLTLIFKILNLRMCFAGVYSANLDGIKFLKKNKFKKIFTYKKRLRIKNNIYCDELIYCLKRKDYLRYNKKL